MPGRANLLRVARATLVVVVLGASALAILELAVRGLYAFAFWSSERSPLVYERVYWAVPPWVAYTSVMYDDPELGLWMRPRSQRTYLNLFGPIGDLADVGALFQSLFPRLPQWARARPVWHLRTNALGLRGADFAPAKPDGTFRVVVLGDSWTVGVNVEEEEAYPAQLAAALGESAGSRTVEILNFGVIGGRAATGRRLLPRVLALQPDLVIVAYAQNDELETRTPGAGASSQPARPPTRWQSVVAGSELARLYAWWTTPGGDRIEATLRHELTRPAGVPVNDPGRPCPNLDAVESPYHAAIDETVRTLQEHGIATVLLYNSVPDFASHCTLVALRSVARARRVALVDGASVLEERARELAAENESRLGLGPRPPRRTRSRDAVDVVFRVDMSTAPSAQAPFVMGNAPQLGDFAPNRVALYDDGSHGDQRAGDGVWSRSFTFALPTVLTYAFTNGGEPGRWTGLENYRLRAFALRTGDFGYTIDLPLAQFGRQTLRSDPSHPDAAGHRAIAESVAQAVRAEPSFVAFAGGEPGSATVAAGGAPPGDAQAAGGAPGTPGRF